MVMYGQLITVMYTGGNLFRISRKRDPDHETSPESTTRTRSPVESAQADDHL
jgi:hypothetical protein